MRPVFSLFRGLFWKDFFFLQKNHFFLGLKFEWNLSVNTERSETDYCWLYCDLELEVSLLVHNVIEREIEREKVQMKPPYVAAQERMLSR